MQDKLLLQIMFIDLVRLEEEVFFCAGIENKKLANDLQLSAIKEERENKVQRTKPSRAGVFLSCQYQREHAKKDR